jgi:hypothetical protein
MSLCPSKRSRPVATTLNEESLLTDFVTSNRDLELLETLAGEFNPFSVLDIEHHEIRHSNVLSWLLDPNEDHGFDDIILKKLIIEVLKHNEIGGFKYSIADFIRHDLTAVSVFREYRVKKKRIDILIRCEDPKFIIIIENKVYSSEGRGQLDTYYSDIREKYPDYELLPVYLTLFGDLPSNTSFASLGYEKVLEVVRSTVDIYGNNISERKLEFIRYYIKALEVLVMDNPEVQRYCKVIYKKHKQAIDLILKYGGSNAFEEAGRSFLQKHNDLIEEIDLRSYML